MSKVLLALARKCITRFYITATLDKLVERSGMDKSMLERQLKIYDAVAKDIDAYVIDTSNKDVNEALREILSVLEASKT